VNGGFAEYTVIDANFALPLGNEYQIHEYASFMCPGVAGYRAYRLTGLNQGDTLGLYGFGITATYVLQIAHAMNIKVFVVTRSQKNQKLARTLGAEWVGDYTDQLPREVNAGILFPPAGHLVPFGLSQLVRGGKLILAPVTMTPIEIIDYNDLWQERSIITLAHITRKDAREFLELSEYLSFLAPKTVFSFEDLPEVFQKVKNGKILGNAVIEFPAARVG
jgi:propanol-preferring alcohol dehydrogenase